MDDRGRGTALRALVAAAAVVVVIGGLSAAGEVILPILFAVFLSIATMPAVSALQRRGVPGPLAIGIVVVLVAGGLIGVGAMLVGAVRTFTADIGKYKPGFDHLTHSLVTTIDSFGFELDEGDLTEWLTPAAIMEFVKHAVNAVVGLFGRLIIVLVTLTFILVEYADLEQKFLVAFGTDAEPAGPFADAGAKVQRYLLIKTMVSVMTGVIAGLSCRVMGLDFWLMWALIAFLLNYIPAFGSFVAAVPPVLLAVVQLGWPYAVAVILVYVAIHVVLGNLLEPRMMGESLGLSPLVVFLSLIFWGWLWGPTGMLLCVPMTVMAKLVFESSDDTRWIAVFLGPPRDARTKATLQPAPPRSLHRG
ncbi:MAG: AI-2E family transporter [Myxococcota bacterium]